MAKRVLYLPPWLNAIAERLTVHPLQGMSTDGHERPSGCRCAGIFEAYTTHSVVLRAWPPRCSTETLMYKAWLRLCALVTNLLTLYKVRKKAQAEVWAR